MSLREELSQFAEGYECLFSPSSTGLGLSCIALIVGGIVLSTADVDEGTPLGVRLDLPQDLVGYGGGIPLTE